MCMKFPTRKHISNMSLKKNQNFSLSLSLNDSHSSTLLKNYPVICIRSKLFFLSRNRLETTCTRLFKYNLILWPVSLYVVLRECKKIIVKSLRFHFHFLKKVIFSLTSSSKWKKPLLFALSQVWNKLCAKI